MVQLYSIVSRSLALPISTMPRFIIPLADKLYSSIGGMPATFARNGTATYIDENGVLQTAAVDVPRFQNGRYLVEPAATNILPYSELLTASFWEHNNVTVVGDLEKDSFKITCGLTGNCNTKTAVIPHTLGVYYTQSAVLEKGNTNFASMTFHYEINSSYAIFNLDTGVVVIAEGCTATIKEYTPGKYRCSITAVSAATLSKASGYITPCRENSVRLQGVLGDYIYATNVQVETGQQMTSYIPTTTVTVTRAADVLYYDVGSVITQGQGSLYCEFVGTIDPASIKIPITVSDGTTSNRFYLYISKTGLLNIEFATSGVLNGVFSSNVVSLGLNKVLITYKTGEVKLYSNGILLSTKTTIVLPLGLNKLNVGSSQVGEFQLNSKVGNVKYFKEVLTPAEAIKLTTV